LTVAIPVYGVSTFLAGLIRRERAIAAHPDLEFRPPPILLIIVHWVFFISATTLFGSQLHMVVRPDISEETPLFISFLTTIFLAFGYLAYSNSTPEYEASENFVSISTLALQQTQFIAGHPYAALSRKSSWGSSCTPLAGVAFAVSSTDESHFPNISFAGKGPAVRLVLQSVTVNWTAESLSKIAQMESDLGKCRDNKGPSRDLSHRDSMEGIVRIGFVSENEAATRGLGYGSAFAWSLLFAGVFHAYSVDSIPVVRLDIHKNNAVVGHIPGCLETAWKCPD
jgi:hypothetical protein